MTTLAPTSSYLEGLLKGQAAVPPSGLPRLNALRAAAVDRVSALTVPTVRDEDWRFTDLSPLTRQSFVPVRAAADIDANSIARFHVAEAATRLVFVDGIYVPALSCVAPQTGFYAGALTSAPAALASTLDAHLGQYGAESADVFNALNTAFLHDAALIVAARDCAVAAPVHVLCIATQRDAASYPRCLLVAEPGCKVTLIEDFVAMQDGAYFTNAVTEIALAEGADVEHVRVQREGPQAFHIGSAAVSLARESRYRAVSVALGARISRYNLDVTQSGAGARCEVDGLALIGERQLADTHTAIDHAQPNGVSRQRHKCIVDGAAHAVFNGRIVVRPGAQRTDSSQSSRNLLLTPRAHVDTKPQLEIFADDVRCAHGATVGQQDADAHFYLVSRGLSATAARNLLTYAFAAEIVERIPAASLRRELEAYVLAQTERRQ